MHQPSGHLRRRWRLAQALVMVVGLLGGLVATGLGAAHAAEDGGTITFSGTLTDGGQPIAGAEVTVTAPDGSEHAGTSDDSGRVAIEAPRMDGAYTVALDEDTLPDGVALRDGEKAEKTRQVTAGTPQVAILFKLGESTRQVQTKWDRVPQLAFNGLKFGLIMALGALGLSMVFGTTGLVNFSHGELVTFGALVTWFLNDGLGFPFVLAALIAVLLGAVFGWSQDRVLWRGLRRRGTGLIAMMIVTIGLMFFLRNLFQYFTQGRTENYAEFVTPEGRQFMGVTYTVRDVTMASISLLVVIVVILALNRTRLGRATRAVADNPALAAATGINVDRVISVVWTIGAALAALSGVFLGFSLSVSFQIGQSVLLLLFAAVTLGGLGSVWGALIGALVIGLLIELSTLVIPSDLKNAGALILLAAILLVRPQGLLGRKERIG